MSKTKGQGPRYNEFEVLYQNMKFGLTATKELVDFLKERSSVEESYSKSLLKLAKIAANANTNGSFAPHWQLLKTSSEKLSNIHLQMTQKVQELVKDLSKYAEELQKKHKSVKEEEAVTLEVVQQIQNSTAMTMKTKKVYQQRHAELEKCQKDNASQTEIEKAEAKTKKAQEEYKVWVDKYQTCRDDYQTKMPLACRHFQQVETNHLQQMKQFIGTYADIMESNHELIHQVNSEFREECNRLTVDELLEHLKSISSSTEAPIVLVDVLGTSTTEEICDNDSLIIPGLGGAGSSSSSVVGGGAGGLLGDDKSLNNGSGGGGGGDKHKTPTGGSLASSASVSAVVEKKKEGIASNESTVSSSGGVVEGSEIKTSKGSRRTTSLLNLFIPLSSQGNKSTTVSSSVNSSAVATTGTMDSPNDADLSVGSGTTNNAINNDANNKPPLFRFSNSRGSKYPDSSSGFLAQHRPSSNRNNNNNNNDHNNESSSTTTASTTSDTLLSSKVLGFLRSRRGKKKDKKNKKDGSSMGKEDKSEGEDKDESQKSETPTAEIDEEGYSVPPKSTWENDKSSFYSSSDTDSDDEREKRLHIEIKPLGNGTAPLSASVDELRSTVENLTLTSTTGAFSTLKSSKIMLHDTGKQMTRSQSVSQQIGSSSPPSRHPYTPLSPPIPPPNPRSSPKLPIGVAGVAVAGINNNNDSVTSTASSRYADLGDLFSEIGDIHQTGGVGGVGGALGISSSVSKLSKSGGQVRNTPTPTSSTTIPRPPSRPRPEPQWNRTNSPSPAVSRTESIGSLERSLGGGSHIIGSRGPSPLTIGMADTIPLAVAFHEIVHASFKGNDERLCQVRMTGDMMLSFPAGIIQVFANNPSPPQLSFQVKSSQPLDNLVSNKELVTVDQVVSGNLNFEFNMSALVVMLKNHAEQNPSASYFNINILKYHILPKSGAASCPLHLVAFWKCESTQTDLRIDYKYNSHAMATTLPEVPGAAGSGAAAGSTPAASTTATTTTTYPPLLQVCIAAPIDGGVKSMQSKPNGQWFPNTNRACWKLPALSSSHENLGVGSLRARFEVSDGPSTAGTIAAQFSCENSTLSGCDFQFSGNGYRVSLIKMRFVSGKYTCEAVNSSSRYAVPPGPPAGDMTPGIQI